ncbi:MAG: DsrE/DsrF/DrsH-like family protein [Gammaproteobacteria bacterium]
MALAATCPPLGTDADLAARVAALEQRVAARKSLTLMIFSGDMDRLLAAFNLAVAAAACGMPVTMFFTFWGSTALKRRTVGGKRGLTERLFGLLLPGGSAHRPLSRFDFLGLGRLLMRRQMRRRNVASQDELIAQCATLGVEFLVCESSMALMGLCHAELIDYPKLETCGAAHFLARANGAATTLFI